LAPLHKAQKTCIEFIVLKGATLVPQSSQTHRSPIGGKGNVAKPFETKDLLDAINEALEQDIQHEKKERQKADRASSPSVRKWFYF